MSRPSNNLRILGVVGGLLLGALTIGAVGQTIPAGGIVPPASSSVAGKMKCDGVTTTCAADGTVTATAGGTAGINQLTGDVAAGPAAGAAAATLATVNAGPGVVGSSTAIPVLTTNGKGLVTAQTTAVVVAPAGTLTGATLAAGVTASSLTSVGTLVGGATGAGFTVNFGTSTISGVLGATNGGTGLSALGTGIATALGINVGSAGAPVLFNGAGGTPSSLVLTNATGLPLAGMANLAANSIIGNNTGAPATPIALTAAQVKTLLAITTANVTGPTGGGAQCLHVDNAGAITGTGSDCGSGGGGSVSVTAASPDIVITPSPGTGTFTVGTTSAANTQTGVSYTVATTDAGKTINRTYSMGAMTDTLPAIASNAAFGAGFSVGLCANSTQQITLTVTTNTINGASSLVIPANTCIQIADLDGVQYTAWAQNYNASLITAGTLAVARGGTGINAFGTGVATALGTAVSGSGAICLASGSACSGGATNLTVGTSTITSGTTTRVLFDNAGIVGEYTVSGTGNVPLTTNPVFTTPNLGTPSALVLTNATGTPSAITLTNGTGLPVAGITGLGTGVGTALGINVGSNGAPVIFNGAGGAPSSLTLTAATGLPLSTGVTGNLPLANLATQAANTVVANVSGSTAVPTAATLPGCSDVGGNHINYISATGFTCGTSTATTALAAGTTVSLTAPRQYYVCTGTCTVTPPVPVAGYEFCVMNDDNVATVITLAALGSSAQYEATARTSYGTAGTGTLVSGGAAKDQVCIVGRDSTHYLTTSSTGTWVAN